MNPRYIIFLLTLAGNVIKEEYTQEPDMRVSYLKTAERDSLTRNQISGFIYFENIEGIWEKRAVRFDTNQSRILLNAYADKFLRDRK